MSLESPQLTPLNWFVVADAFDATASWTVDRSANDKMRDEGTILATVSADPGELLNHFAKVNQPNTRSPFVDGWDSSS